MTEETPRSHRGGYRAHRFIAHVPPHAIYAARTNLIGVILADIANPFSSAMLEGFPPVPRAAARL